MSRARKVIAAATGGAGLVAVVQRWQRADAETRTPDDELADRPGDDLVPQASIQLDRTCVLPVPAEQVWPWLVQLGKHRAGWYLPRTVERFLPPGRRALWHIESRWQTHEVGDRVPDWGPGTPVLELVRLERARCLVYLSLRDRADGHRWPREPDSPAVLHISWSLTLDELSGGRCRLALRLRADPRGRPMRHLADYFDALTVFGLFAGLRERLDASAGRPYGDR